MNKIEIQAATKAKVEKINALAKELQVQIRAEQVITDNNVIRTVVTYTDVEKYDMDPVVTRAPLPEQSKTDAENTSI